MAERPDKRHESFAPTNQDVKGVLRGVFEAPAFANSPRLQDFLSYIVAEEIAGRGRDIKGKTIAVEVYGREIDEAGAAQNLVRVEARRLRRALDEYYAHEGAADPLVIHLDVGGYQPRIERRQTTDQALAPADFLRPDASETTEARRVQRPRPIAVMGVAVAVLIVGATYTLQAPSDGTDANAVPDNARLSALRERSMTSVQAVNLADHARGQFFPLFDAKRQQINLETFMHAKELDAGLPDGFAGAAQVLALKAVMSPDAESAAEYLARASDMAEKAVAVAPLDGWSNAAMAWVHAVDTDYETAMRKAAIAVNLAPEDGHVLDLAGLTALLSGDAEFMSEVSSPDRPREGSGRFGANSIWGASQLILQNYQACIDAFSSAAHRGLPVSAPSLFLLATAHSELGDKNRAVALLDEMKATWPSFPAEAAARKFFRNHPETLERVLATLSLNST